jgi:hypothetical protein
MMAAIVIAATLTPVTAAADWPTYHYDAARTGNQPGQGLIRSQTSLFKVRVDGEVFAEPLVAGNRVLIATENNSIYSLDANSGAVQWGAHLGAPVPQNQLPCGNIDPVGITGTPVIDTAAGLIYAVGLVWVPGNSGSIRYQMFALNLSNGSVRWQRPISGFGSPFDPRYQGQRMALSLSNGIVYIGFGGRAGDCGDYRGWIVGAPANGVGGLIAFSAGGAFWASGGPSSDAAGNIFAASGNTCGPCPVTNSETVLKLGPSLAVSDHFTPSNQASLNSTDTDLGSVTPALLGTSLVFQVGKEGVGYLLNQSNLGGVNHATPAYSARVCSATADAAFGATAYAPPLLYVPCANRLEALTVTTGATPSFASAWHGPATTFSTPPVVAGNLVWTIDTNGLLSGLDAGTGSVVISMDLGVANHFATPAVDNGRLYVPAGTLVYGFSLSPWFAWEKLDGSLTSGPSVASWGANHLDVFARGADQSLMQKTYDNGTWSGWTSLGGILGGTPGAVSWASGRIDVFVQGTDNQLWHRPYSAGAWQAWESLGGTITSGPTVASWASGRLDVFARGPDNSLYHKWLGTGGWSGWESLGGILGGDPGAVSWASGRIDAFVRGTDSLLWHRWYENGWSAWESLGGNISSGPAVSTWGTGRLDVFARGADGTLNHKWYGSNSWFNWETLGGQIADRPGAASWAVNRVDVLVEGTDNVLWHRWIS